MHEVQCGNGRQNEYWCSAATTPYSCFTSAAQGLVGSNMSWVRVYSYVSMTFFLLTIQKGPANGSFYLFPCPYWYALQGRRTALRTAIRHVLLEHQSDASYSLRSREADALFRISIFHIFFWKESRRGAGDGSCFSHTPLHTSSAAASSGILYFAANPNQLI